MPLSVSVLGDGGSASPDIESRFFAKIRLPNGTWKTTYRRRLDDVNELLLEHLPKSRPLELMDVAVSSGVTTLEWGDGLRAAGVEHRLLAGDLMVEGRLAAFGRRAAILYDRDETPLLIELGRLGVSVRSARRSVRTLRPLLEAGARLVPRGYRRVVPLVTPSLGERDEIEVVEDDVTRAGVYADRFDVVRAANIVQPVYFDRATIALIFANLRDRLRDGGLLAVCQTVEGRGNQATVFRRRGDRLEEVASLGGGVAVRELAPSV
jgi:hypothetical protein